MSGQRARDAGRRKRVAGPGTREEGRCGTRSAGRGRMHENWPIIDI